MRRLSIGSFAAAVLGVLVLASLLLFSGGEESAQAATGTTDPVLGSVTQVAIDMDITTVGSNFPGDGSGLIGTIQTSNSIPFSPPAVATAESGTDCTGAGIGVDDDSDSVIDDGCGFANTLAIDVIVDEVHPTNGMTGSAYNLKYDPAIIEITSKTLGGGTTMLAPGTGFFDFSEGLPDTDGNWRSDTAGGPLAPTFGEGVLDSLVITCVGRGQSFLDLGDDIGPGLGLPLVADAGFAPLAVLADGDAQIGCGVPAATSQDVEITSETIHGEPTIGVGGPATSYTVDKTIVNNSSGTVDVTLATIVSAPADCTVSVDSTPLAITAVSAPVGTDAEVTIVGHGLSTGDYVVISGVTGTFTGAGGKDVNHLHSITVTGTDTFTLDGVINYLAATGFGTATPVIGTPVTGLDSSGTTASAGFTLECADPSFHDLEITNEIFLDAPKLYGTCDTADNCAETTPSNNSIAHTTSFPAAVGTPESGADCLTTQIGVDDDSDGTDDDGCSPQGVAPATASGSNATTLGFAAPGPKVRIAVTADADADIDTANIVIDVSNLTDTDNAVSGDELKKGETVQITIEKDIILNSSEVFDVTFNLTTTATAPSGCTVNGSFPTAVQTTSVTFSSAGTLPADQNWTLACTAAGTAPGFLKTWSFSEVLTPDDQHVTNDAGAVDTNSESVIIPVIEPFVTDLNVDHSSLDSPAESGDLPEALDECLTTLGCEQEFEESMGPDDPFASVFYVDIPKTGGFTILDDAALINGTTVGTLLATTTIVYDGGSGCGSPATASVGGSGVALTDASAAAASLPEPLATTPGTDAFAHYVASITGFAGGEDLRIDIVIYDNGSSYRQYRIASDGLGGSGTLAGDWASITTVCSGEIDYNIHGEATDTNGLELIRVCDTPGTHTLPAQWTRDDTTGTYTDADSTLAGNQDASVACSALDVSVQLTKDEVIGDDIGGGDVVDQGVPTARDVAVNVAGPPDTILTMSIVGPVECAPRWVAPLDPAPSVLNGIQTSVIVVDPATDLAAAPFNGNATYEVTCSPAGTYNLQIVANVVSATVPVEPNPLNNQAENVVQVIVTGDSDGDGVDSPQDNCPNTYNPNQNDADSDGEGNVCDLNDDDDFTPWMVAETPPANVWTPVLPILDFPLGPGISVYPATFFSTEITAGPDQCNPGIDLTGAGPDLDALSAAELALWQEDPDDFLLEDDIPFTFDPLGFNLPNEDLDLDGCADTDMSVAVDKDELYDVNVSESTLKTVTITVTNGNAAVGGATVNVLALSRIGKCEVRLVAETGDLYSEFSTDELTLTPPIDGPAGTDDYDPTPDGILDTLHSQAEISTGPMAADDVLVLTRDYTIHCFQPSDQLWWDSIKEDPASDFNFDATFELQVDVLPNAPVVEENLGIVNLGIAENSAANACDAEIPGIDNTVPPDGDFDDVEGDPDLTAQPADDVAPVPTATANCGLPSACDAGEGLGVDDDDDGVVDDGCFSNIHKNFPLVTSNAVADLKYQLTITGPDVVQLGVITDIEGFSTIHNNGPAPMNGAVYGNFLTPAGCALSLGDGAFIIPPGVDSLADFGFPIPLIGPQDAPIPPSVEIIVPVTAGESQMICIQPSFHIFSSQLFINAEWPVAVDDAETGEACQNFVDDDNDDIVNDGCPNHTVDPDLSNNGGPAVNSVAAVGETQVLVNVDTSAVPTAGVVSQDEFFDVTKSFTQAITPFYNPFLEEDGEPNIPQALFFSCSDGADNGTDTVFDNTDPDCFQGALPGVSIFPLITETLSPEPDCSVSFHVTNGILSQIIGGAAGLTISVDGVVQTPPTAAGWEASDVVRGDPGQPVTIDFKVEIGGLSILPVTAGGDGPTVIVENWDKHCYVPSTHSFALNTSWTMSDMDDLHLPYADGGDEATFSEDITADSDLKIVTDFFLDLEDIGTDLWRATYVPASGDAETGNNCENSVDDDSDGIVNDGCPAEGHQKEALHNNGPYGPTDATVTLVATASGACNVAYDVRGDEDSVGGQTPPAIQPGDRISSGLGGSIEVVFPANLPVSTDVWFAELWLFSSVGPECDVVIDKTVEADDVHILNDVDNFSKTVIVCQDNDNDGIHNTGANCNGPDPCPNDPGGLTDTDGDGVGDACDPDPDRPPVDGTVKYVLTIGPAAINLSDTTGRYMWIIAEIGENGSDPGNVEVTVTLATPEAVPNGCTRTPADDSPDDGSLSEALVLPGQDNFILLDDEQKSLVWRLRYECHDPATQGTFDQTITVTIDVTGDQNPANDTQTVVKTVIIG